MEGPSADDGSGLPPDDATPPAVATTAPPVDVVRRTGLDRKLIAALFAAGVLLLVAGWFAYAAHANDQAAEEWQQRAVGLEEQVNGLRTLIGERSAQLNERTRQANRLATNLRATRGALQRSESDVTSLARRQRELANEKARLEDQRRALQRQAADLEDIAGRATGRLGDFGIVRVSGKLPQVGTLGGAVVSGERVTAVGYPLGGELRPTAGVVVDLVDGPQFEIPGRAIRLTAPAQPGNSGGPLLDRTGRIVGVVFAKEIATGLTLAISIATLKTLVRTRNLEAVPGCGVE